MSLIVGCSCETGNGNTGLPNCSEAFGLAIGLGFQNVVNAGGTLNSIDLNVSSITTEFSSLLTNADKTIRMFPVTDIRNVDFPKEDTQYETDNAGAKEEVREGIQSFMAEKWKVPAGFDLKLKQMKCSRNGAYIFTRAGVIGVKKSTYGASPSHLLYPIEITSFAPDWRPQTASTVAKEMIPFDFNPTVNVGELWLVSWDELNTTYEAMIGLIDVNYDIQDTASSTLGTTTIGVRITTDYGSGLVNDQTVDGLVTANFTVTDKTTGLAVANLSVTEVVDDKYTISYDSETPGDTIEIAVATSTGYEGTITFTEPS